MTGGSQRYRAYIDSVLVAFLEVLVALSCVGGANSKFGQHFLKAPIFVRLAIMCVKVRVHKGSAYFTRHLGSYVPCIRVRPYSAVLFVGNHQQGFLRPTHKITGDFK